MSSPSSSNMTSMASSENCSPCSTGPSSQGPASPQSELASPGCETKLSVTAAAFDSGHVHNKMATVAGYLYPSFAMPPAAVYATSESLIVT